MDDKQFLLNPTHLRVLGVSVVSLLMHSTLQIVNG